LQIVLYGLHEDPALVDKRTDQPVTQVFIFPIVTPLSEIKGLVDYPTQFFREYSWFHKPPVKVTDDSAVFGRSVRFEDKQGQNCVKHGIIRSIYHGARTLSSLKQKSGLVTTFFGLLQAILGQRDLTFADSQTGIPSFRMTL